jgi:hypothetical protein
LGAGSPELQAARGDAFYTVQVPHPISLEYPSIVQPVDPPAARKCTLSFRSILPASKGDQEQQRQQGAGSPKVNGSPRAASAAAQRQLSTGTAAVQGDVEDGGSQALQGSPVPVPWQAQARKGWWFRAALLALFPITIPVGVGVLAYMVRIGKTQHARYASMTFDHSWVEEAWAEGRKGRRKSSEPLSGPGSALADSDGASSRDAASTSSPATTPRAGGQPSGAKSARRCALLIPHPTSASTAADQGAGTAQPAKQLPVAGARGESQPGATSQQQEGTAKEQAAGAGMGPRVLVRQSLETRPSASGELVSGADEGDVDVMIEDIETEVSG